MKKLITTLALVLCLVLAPCTMLLTGCKNKEDTPQDEEITVKNYLTTDETWAIYSEVENNIKYDQMPGCDNMSVAFSVPANYSAPSKVDYCKVNGSFVMYSEGVNQSTNTTESQVSFKYNDKFYIYNPSNEFCEEATIDYTSPKYLFGMYGFELFSKENVVSGKVMSNNDYVIIVSSDDLGPAIASDSLSFELTLSSNLQFKNFKVIELSGDDIVTIEVSFTYGNVSVAEITALVEEAISHIE